MARAGTPVLVCHRPPARNCASPVRRAEAGQGPGSDHHCFYRALIEGALDIVTVVDEFGTIFYGSLSAEQHLGYRPDEIIGRNLFEFVHPDDIERARATLAGC